MPSTERIENSYRYADGVNGGYASELWLVKGVDSMMAISDQAVGLPKIYDPHPINNNLIVRERVIETIVDPQTTIVRIEYRQATFDIGTMYATSVEFSKEIRLKLLWTKEDTAGSNGLVLRGGSEEPQFDFVIYPTIRKFTVRAGGDINDVVSRIVRNKNCYYTSREIPIGQNDPPHLFIDGQARQLKNGQVIADYSFLTNYGIRGPAQNGSFPLGTYKDQAFAIPFISPMATIYTSLRMAQDALRNGTSPYEIKQAREIYPLGQELTGL
jgi:hypothetical protein